VKSSCVHNLTKALALVSLLTPVSGNSLGIGDIKLHSTLNQNLDAEISLVVSPGDKASDIKVNFAPPNKFDEAGIPWTSFLSKIKFQTIAGANGSATIKLSSREAVKEPFLDFLLQVNWPKGSLYREFTVLLDPPPAYNQASIPTLANLESYKPEQEVVSQNESIYKQQTRVERSISEAGRYGPTNRNDTLWKVAEQARGQAGVSVEQMMIAMYEENPHAFYKENINALLTGKILKIPAREIVIKLSRRQALDEFNRQTKSWKNRLEPAPIAIVSAKKDTPDNLLTLVAPAETDVDKSTIITPENEQVTAKKQADDTAASKTINTEDVITAPSVNLALQDKVSELEKQLATMQQILALKDQQLAALQNQSQIKPVVKAEPVQAAPGHNEVINPVTQQPAPPVAKPVIQSEPQVRSLSNINYLWGGGALLSLLGWLWWRKHKLDGQTHSQSLPPSSSISMATESKGEGAISIEKDGAKNADAGGKHPLFSAFTLGDIDTFDTDQSEIDPVSEAEVYLAYGRYQQAEELMRDVIKDQPNRDECKLKLLKIFFLDKNKHAFETYANELAKAGKKDDVEFWAKVYEMGSEVCKDSILFTSQAEGFSQEENAIFEKETVKTVEFDDIEKNEVTDIPENNFSLSSFGESFNNEAVKEIPQSTVKLLYFDEISDEDEVIGEQQNNQSIDFDLSTIVTKIEKSSKTLENIASNRSDIEVNHEFESFDFDFYPKENGIKRIDEIDASAVMGSVENSQITDSQPNEPSSLSSNSINNSLKRNLYVDKSRLESNGEDFNQQGGLDVFDLTDMDELETKLDLAKAYVDMNDTDAAKDMASEVLDKGTVEQKQVAQALLDDLK
jgi:pilus assembly protein FimV